MTRPHFGLTIQLSDRRVNIRPGRPSHEGGRAAPSRPTNRGGTTEHEGNHWLACVESQPDGENAELFAKHVAKCADSHEYELTNPALEYDERNNR